MRCEREVIAVLNDGEFHSGEELAKQLGGISRAAVWKLIRNLQKQGIDIYAVRGRGYRLAEPMEFLDLPQITAGLTDKAGALLGNIEIHQSIDSTNTYLMNQAENGLASGSVCFAEEQSAGRGRRGRTWVSPYAANLYLSMLWRFPLGPTSLSGLSLAVGVALARALEGMGIAELGLKWPNDLLWQQRKLGGILLEFGGESSGPCHVVAGLGLNIAMPASVEDAIDQPWIDLRGIQGARRVSRNQVAAQVLNELVVVFTRFENGGFPGISQEWKRFDQVAGQRVTLKLPNDAITGTARGVDDTGALLLETATGIRRFLGGEISLRVEE